MSFKGRVLVINNLVSSMLWHCLMCVDPPPQLLAKIQAVLVNFFWDHLHWVPQCLLFLPKEEGGHGLIHLASRGATFRLPFIQRLLVRPYYIEPRRKFGSSSVIVFNGSEDSQPM